MGLRAATDPPRVIVRTYGRGSFLGLLSPLLAYVMAAAGTRGWQDSTAQAMEKDAIELGRQGYRVASTEEATLPVFGIASYKVTYELIEPPGSGG
jgi:hypothetical protein